MLQMREECVGEVKNTLEWPRANNETARILRAKETKVDVYGNEGTESAASRWMSGMMRDNALSAWKRLRDSGGVLGWDGFACDE